MNGVIPSSSIRSNWTRWEDVVATIGGVVRESSSCCGFSNSIHPKSMTVTTNNKKLSFQSYLFLIGLAVFTIYTHARIGLLQIIVTTDDIEIRHNNNNHHIASLPLDDSSTSTNPGKKYPKVVMGIFTSDLGKHEMRYRNTFRDLLQIYYPKVCSLYNYTQSIPDSRVRKECELLYTFVLGGAKNDRWSTNVTEIVNNYTYPNRPLTLAKPTKPAKYATDYWQKDMTFLNIL